LGFDFVFAAGGVTRGGEPRTRTHTPASVFFQ